MISATVLYPKTEDSHFNLDYYLNTHTPLVRKLLTSMGLTDVDLRSGLAGAAPDTSAAYAMICNLSFGTIEEVQNALAKRGPELMADIPNFTDAVPLFNSVSRSGEASVFLNFS
ncbi:EthD family reductase [Flavobacterium sp.]|uniref:EthD family reductase n=1 Tax=Flavobacterium sp. TaxID=239 RepID=UPI003C388E04